MSNAKRKNETLKTPVQGTIVKADGQQLETYTLDNGYTWGDSKGRWNVGDNVIVKPYIMGTVKVERIN